MVFIFKTWRYRPYQSLVQFWSQYDKYFGSLSGVACKNWQYFNATGSSATVWRSFWFSIYWEVFALLDSCTIFVAMRGHGTLQYIAPWNLAMCTIKLQFIVRHCTMLVCSQCDTVSWCNLVQLYAISCGATDGWLSVTYKCTKYGWQKWCYLTVAAFSIEKKLP